MSTYTPQKKQKGSEKNTSIKFIIYFQEKQYYTDQETGELIEKQVSMNYHPYLDDTTLKKALYYVKKVLLGKEWEDNTPKKVVIYENSKLIWELPKTNESICEDRREVSKLATALNELERYIVKRSQEATDNLPHVPRTKVIPVENTNTELRELKNSVYKGIQARHLTEQSWTPSESKRAIEALRNRNDEESIKNYFHEHFNTTQKQEVEQKIDIPQPIPQSKEKKEPVSIGQILKKTPRLATNQHLEVTNDLIESFVDLLARDYEQTSRKATDSVRNTFKKAYSACKTKVEIEKVYANFVIQIERGEF